MPRRRHTAAGGTPHRMPPMKRAAPAFPRLHFPQLEGVPLPEFRRVTVEPPEGPPPVDDVEAAVMAEIARNGGLDRLAPGARVAIAVGSRGVAEIPRLARAAVAACRERGLEPFIVPGMGSHGGATAEGQVAVLARLGVTEEACGAPIRSSMEVVEIGRTDDGIPAWFDANAAAADGVIAINRVKAHTSFDRPNESGIVKMLAVGLGKHRGAVTVHTLGPRGLAETLPKLAEIILAKAPILMGLAVVEDGRKRICHVEAVAPDAFFERDAALLVLAKSIHAKLPFEAFDALVVQEIGKDVSGAGMDLAVCGRADIRGIPNPPPLIRKIGVLGLTEATAGNAVGFGVADFSTVAAASELDLFATYTNALTAGTVERVRMPVILPSDLDVFRACAKLSWRLTPEESRMVVIRSTLHVSDIAVSVPLLEETIGGLRLAGEPVPWAPEFDAEGRFTNPL